MQTQFMKIWFSEDLRDDFYRRAFTPYPDQSIKQTSEMFPCVMQSVESLTSHPSGHSAHFGHGWVSIWVCMWLTLFFPGKLRHLTGSGPTWWRAAQAERFSSWSSLISGRMQLKGCNPSDFILRVLIYTHAHS